MMSPTAVEDDLRAADREQLEAHGIGVDEARRQLAILRDPPPKARLVRPALLGDGIDPLPAGSEADRLAEAGRAAASSGRLVRFVPASGAASRLFAELKAAAAAGAPDDPVLGRFEKARRHLPFDAAAGATETLERYGDTPKALIPFHRYPGGEVRTALEEHLVEAAAVLGEGGGLAALQLLGRFAAPAGVRGVACRAVAGARAALRLPLRDRPLPPVGGHRQHRPGRAGRAVPAR